MMTTACEHRSGPGGTMACTECQQHRVKLHDNINTVLSTLHHHRGRYTFTGGALRRMAYMATGREYSNGGWTVGFRRMVGVYVTSRTWARRCFLCGSEMLQPGREWLTTVCGCGCINSDVGRPLVDGHVTYGLTRVGLERIRRNYNARKLLTSEQTDPMAFLSDWERYANDNVRPSWDWRNETQEV